MRALEESVIYFVEAIGLDRIKIGFTSNIVKRISTIQTYCPAPIRLLLAEPGDIAEERRLHRRCFPMLQVSGEWYKKHGRIVRAAIQWREMLPHCGNRIWQNSPGLFWSRFYSEWMAHKSLSRVEIASRAELSEWLDDNYEVRNVS